MSHGAVVAVRVTPRASRESVEAAAVGGELRIRVTAPPADGAANAAVVKLMARTLGVPRSAVALVSGASSRHKRLRIDGVSARSLRARWPGLSVADA